VRWFYGRSGPFGSFNKFGPQARYKTRKLRVASTSDPASDGIKLTSHGHQVMETAKRMEDAAVDLLLLGAAKRGRVARSRRPGSEHKTRFGPLWLAPRLSKYQSCNPDVVVELLCTFDQSTLRRWVPKSSYKLAGLLQTIQVGEIGSNSFCSHRQREVPQGASNARRY
jgi:hypothetical protein